MGWPVQFAATLAPKADRPAACRACGVVGSTELRSIDWEVEPDDPELKLLHIFWRNNLQDIGDALAGLAVYVRNDGTGNQFIPPDAVSDGLRGPAIVLVTRESFHQRHVASGNTDFWGVVYHETCHALHCLSGLLAQANWTGGDDEELVVHGIEYAPELPVAEGPHVKILFLVNMSDAEREQALTKARPDVVRFWKAYEARRQALAAPSPHIQLLERAIEHHDSQCLKQDFPAGLIAWANENAWRERHGLRRHTRYAEMSSGYKGGGNFNLYAEEPSPPPLLLSDYLGIRSGTPA